MKRELAFAMESRSQIPGYLGRTRSSKGFGGSINHSDEMRGSINRCNGANAPQSDKRLNEIGDSVTLEEPEADSVTPMSEDRQVVQLPLVASPRRFTRSVLKSSNGQSVESELGKGNEVAVAADINKIKSGSAMLKKIEVNKRPSTLRELFETGLLEGYPVFCNGGKEGLTPGGAIKDIGILCYCSLCKGSRVVPPSGFVLHNCTVYKPAAQYICLENGKSLLDVLKACNNTSLETLITTIQSVIGPLTRKDFIICQNCKGAGNMGQLCDSCMDSVKKLEITTNSSEMEPGSIIPVVVVKAPTGDEVCASSPKSRKRKQIETGLDPLSPRRASVRILALEKGQQKLTKKSMTSTLVPKPTGSASACNLSQKKSREKISNEIVSVLKSPRSAPMRIRSQIKIHEKISTKLSKSVAYPNISKSASNSRLKITKKDQRMHRLIFAEGGLPNGTELTYYSRGKKLLEGYKTSSGIFCRCCHSEVSPSQFEAHAGWQSRRKPYGYIYTSNGVSLHEFALSLLKDREYSDEDNDDLCVICADGGELLLCDGCPRSFHKECASLPTIPHGKWYCKFCQNMFQREKFVERNENAVAAGRVSGVDPIEQITERCIRIVKNPEDAGAIACVLCSDHDYSKSGFGLRTVILCDQCEKEYHVGCLKKHKMADLQELPKGKWFCCLDCQRIYSALQNLLVSGDEKLPDSLLDITRKKHMDNLEGESGFDVRWRLLSAKISSRETRLHLSEAVAIFHDCFDPIVDSASGRDYIPSMVYGRNIMSQDFAGMYCAILTVNSTVVSAGLLRIFGSDIAELPLVATSKANQGKGYFQLLFTYIEKLLAFLNVRSLVLPAAEEAKSIWTDKFGFKIIPPEQLKNYRRRCCQMLTFEGTSMLEKAVPKCHITR